jgi:hypothetical protein
MEGLFTSSTIEVDPAARGPQNGNSFAMLAERFSDLSIRITNPEF